MIISFQLDFVYPSYKKDLDENESIKVKVCKICDRFCSAQLSAPFGKFGVNGVNPRHRNSRNPHKHWGFGVLLI